jgi:hypothetical protein
MSKRVLSRSVFALLILVLLFGPTGFMLRATSFSSPVSTQALTSSSTSLSPSLALLGGGAKWAAGNGSSVLYVDWKDSWVNHHLTDGASWGPWPLEESMDNWTTWVSDALTSNGLNVHLAGDIPDNLTGYDLVVLHAYWAIEPRHEPLLHEFIANGGGVVVLSGAAEFLRHYCKDWWTYALPLDNASELVNEWLGSNYYINTGGLARVTVDSPLNTSLAYNSVLFDSPGWSNAAVSGLHDGCNVVATWDSGLAFAYTYSYGSGRVYYQADLTDQATFQNSPPPPPPPPPPPSNSTTPIVVRIEPENLTVKKDEVFSVSVVIENIPADPGAVGVQFIITWDPTVLNGVNITEVMFHEVTPPAEYDNIWQIWNSVNNSYAQYACLWQDNNRALNAGYLPISGNHTVATIELKAMADGATTLHFSNLIVGDMNGDPLVYRSTGPHTPLWNNIIIDSIVIVDPPTSRDLNGDGRVDVFDAMVFASHFGSKFGDSNWYAPADFNGDREVDIMDALILCQAFGTP